MPLLFISYKRGTSSIIPLMERLQAAKYRLWYDKDDIHVGDNWREAIDRGVDLRRMCIGACASLQSGIAVCSAGLAENV